MTVRLSDPSRTRNLDMTLDWYRGFCRPDEKVEFIVVEQDDRSKLKSERFAPGVHHSFVPNSGPFNKSWGMNIAARQANGEVFAILDADVLVNHTILQASIHSLSRDYDVVSPYERLIDLDEQQTEELRRDRTAAREFFQLPAQDRRQHEENLCYCGGLFLINRKFYFEIGGMDERFEGWGGEDDAMTLKVARFSNRIAAVGAKPALHLWHPRTECSAESVEYRKNRALLADYFGLTEQEWRNLVKNQRSSMGRPGRYSLDVPD